MTNVVYSKCSTERSSKYRIVTKIIEKNGQKFVTKEAVTQESIAHIEALMRHYDDLQNLYKNTTIQVLKGRKVNDFTVEFPYVFGENLEGVFENLLERGEEEKILEWVQIIADSYYKNPNLIQFEVSEQFKKIFGNPSISDKKKALPISNLDSIFANYILEEDKLIMIDYEWVLDCQIPVDFILYRALFHSPAIQKMAKSNIGEAYNIAKVSVYDREQYFLMEQNFQRYVRDGQVDLEAIYKRINNHCYSLKLENENEIFNDYEVYFDGRCAYREHTIDTSILIRVNVPEDTKTIKFVLNQFNGIYKIIKIIGINNNIEEEISISESNSDLVIIDDYYFLEFPEIVVNNNHYEAVYIEYKILEKNISCINQLINSLKQANQYKNEADLYKKQVEDYKAKADEYINAYYTLENQINQIHETLTWKIGEKIGKITRR